MKTVVVPVLAAQTVIVCTPSLPPPFEPPLILLAATPQVPSIVLATEPKSVHVPAQSTLMAMQAGFVSQRTMHWAAVRPAACPPFCRFCLDGVVVLLVRARMLPV